MPENLIFITPLTEDQKAFITSALEQGFDVYAYSGRMMFGAECPAINVNGIGEFTSPVKYSWDNMGKGFVIYVP